MNAFVKSIQKLKAFANRDLDPSFAAAITPEIKEGKSSIQLRGMEHPYTIYTVVKSHSEPLFPEKSLAKRLIDGFTVLKSWQLKSTQPSKYNYIYSPK